MKQCYNSVKFRKYLLEGAMKLTLPYSLKNTEDLHNTHFGDIDFGIDYSQCPVALGFTNKTRAETAFANILVYASAKKRGLALYDYQMISHRPKVRNEMIKLIERFQTDKQYFLKVYKEYKKNFRLFQEDVEHMRYLLLVQDGVIC